MEWLDGSKTRLMLIGVVAAMFIGGGGRTMADFVIGDAVLITGQ